MKNVATRKRDNNLNHNKSLTQDELINVEKMQF